jgi:catechol 2,3-dioxygenase-like lactoylglutathione lyase family enzyme
MALAHPTPATRDVRQAEAFIAGALGWRRVLIAPGLVGQADFRANPTSGLPNGGPDGNGVNAAPEGGWPPPRPRPTHHRTPKRCLETPAG